MPKLIDIRDTATLVFIGGTICTGKDTAKDLVSARLRDKGYDNATLSMGDCLMALSGLTKDSPREEYGALFEGKENDPWIARTIAEKIDIESGKILVVSGLRRKCDAEYFHTTFPNRGYFISLMADEDTLVQRIIARNRGIDFPPGTPEEQKKDIAKKLLAKEEKTHKIWEMMGYINNEIPKEKQCLIYTGKETGTSYLESQIDKALTHFTLV